MHQRTSSRLAWVGVALLALLGGVLFASHLSERREIARLAARVDGGRTLTNSQRLALYTRFADHGLRDPRYDEVRPGLIRLYYLLNPLHPGPGDVLQWGSDYRGPCGSHCRVVAAMLSARGVPSRLRLLLDGSGNSIHTVVEALSDGRWVVGDAAYGIAFQQRDGRPATAAYLAADTAFLRAQVESVPGYDRAYRYDSTTLLNWKKIPVVLPAIRAGLVGILGPARVDGLVRPGIWMWPRLFYSLVCLALSAALGFWTWWSRRSYREPAA